MKCPHCGKEITIDELFGGKAKEIEDRDVVFDFSQTGTDVEPLQQGHGENKKQTQAVPADRIIENASDSAEKELAALAKELDSALRDERYERAAEIRDRVAALKKMMIGEEPKEA